MGLFGKIFDTAVDVVKLPVDVTLDKFTLGGKLIGKDKSFTEERLRDLAGHADDLLDEISDD